MVILLVVLILVFAFGGIGYNGGAYRNEGLSLGGVILVALLLLWATGNLH